MSFRFLQPSNEDEFELFCLRLLREVWQCPALQLYGKRGERQHGIDLIDEAGGPPLRAVQCKHHEPDKTIPPAEIEAEVTEALGSGLPLDEYYVLTTARKTTHSQNAVIQINRDHQAAGRFKVFLWTWADIEERLSQLDDATQDRVVRGATGRGGPAVCRMLGAVMTEHFDRPLYASAGVLDLALDAVKNHIDRHELEVAEHKLDELAVRAADKLQPAHWYQLKALRSRVFTHRWEWEKAGRELLDAKRFTPDTERARINEALGYELTGAGATAHTLATALKSEYAHSARLAALWVRTAPEDAAFDGLVAAAAPFIPTDEEMNLALAHHAVVRNLFAEADQYARRATDLDPESPQAWLVRGMASHGLGFNTARGVQKDRLREAEDYYSRAVRIAHEHKIPRLEAAARFNRGKVRHLLGESSPDADFLAAVGLARPEDGLRTQYASYLMEVGRFGDALRELAADTSEPTAARLFYEAAARLERKTGDDRERAVDLLRRAVRCGPGDRWADAHALLVQCAVEAGAPDDARATITGSGLSATHPLLFHTLCGWLAELGGDHAAAKAEYRVALGHLTDATSREEVFLLAQTLASAGDDDLALPLFLRTYRPGLFNLECRKLLGCAHRLARHEVTVRACRELREAGEADPRIVLAEIQVLQLYDPQDAFRVAREYLASHPDDRHVALWQSALALRLDRRDSVIADLDRLPAPADVTPEGSGLVLRVLEETGQYPAALRYAYDALREHFDAEFAHGQYVAYFLRLSPHCPELAFGDTVQPGTAVCYGEEDGGDDRWLIIEDGADPELARSEVPPAHELSKALVGRRVGESAVVSEGGVQPRALAIRDALHKYVFRFRDCLNQFQVRFPGAFAIQLVRVGSGDGFDPSPIIKSLKDQRTRVESVDDLYRTHPLPLYTYANWVGRDEFAAWGHCASTPNLGLRCCDDQADDLGSALERVGSCHTLVLDLTALHTLARLDLLPVLGATGRSLAVAQSTFDRIRHLADDAAEERESVGMFVLAEGDELGRVPALPGQRDRYATFLRTICDRVKDHCRVLPCLQAAGLDPQRREQLVEVLGRHNLDSMLLAAEPGATLWSDDLVLGIIGRADFGATRVWTQAVLYQLLQEGHVTRTEFDRAVAKLAGWQYLGISCNADTLVAAAEVAEWDTTAWPVPQVMRTLRDNGVNVLHRLTAAATAIRSVWQRELPDHSREGFLFAVLCGIASVKRIRTLARLVPGAFYLDVINAHRVRQLIGYWLQHPTGLLYP